MPRPKSFDPDTVLAKAMGVFWEKGYDAASISELTAAMGINRFSLYDTFGDKHELYLKALDAYDQQFVEPMLEKINAINTLNELQAHFFCMIDAQHAGADAPCCMMQKAAISMAPVDDQAKQRVECVQSRLHDAFCQVFQRLRDSNELDPHIGIEDAAWQIMIAQTGLISFAASPIPAKQAKSAIQSLIRHFHA